ncbi:hypothetical protein [Pseudochryseolinea flava]|uniref:Bacterial Ig-like domain-containing protein n=1 Tax=Pseudochryseolinea flava TaxID=2059302 RepID=A0A364XUW4_9BACT|nr:hypothetical protein [Pseudochryseolinea flava]RAV98086.1 hypothetical protein DQQ10_25470 [Pseudochryseolinea flava]
MEITALKVSLDGRLLKEGTFDVAEAKRKISWDTKSADDGPHMLKVMASDDAANVTEKEFVVTVDNFLVTVPIPDDYLNGTFTDVDLDRWIFIHKKRGCYEDNLFFMLYENDCICSTCKPLNG